MNLKRIVATLLAALAAPCISGNASLRSTQAPAGHHTFVLNLSDLRSAYLQRSGVVRYDASNMSPAGLRQQLRRHFDVVLEVLLVSTPQSIETALTRLEAADDHTWTADERRAWRRQLLATRHTQLRRLAAYRDSGLFPLNEGQVFHAVPIFVDRHDTACAVGHLMRLSGWAEEVAQIQKSNNLVYVPDALRSAVASWALTSGLTREEAALIQPAYGWPGEYDAADYEPLELKLEKNGLRFENFQLQAVNYIEVPSNLPPEICQIVPQVCVPEFIPTTEGTHPVLQGLGLLTGQGFYAFNGYQYPQHTPIGTHWLAIAGSRFSTSQPSLHRLGATAAEGRGQLVTIKFDVSAIAANQRINGISESSYLYQSGFMDPTSFSEPAAIYYLHTTARDAALSIASLSIDQGTIPIGYFQKLDTESFSPRQKISVQSDIWLQDGVAINTFLLDFNVMTVPEPSAFFVGVIGLMIACVVRVRRQV